MTFRSFTGTANNYDGAPTLQSLVSFSCLLEPLCVGIIAALAALIGGLLLLRAYIQMPLLMIIAQLVAKQSVMLERV